MAHKKGLGSSRNGRVSRVRSAGNASSGTVRLFQNGEVVLHIEPLARPLIWRHFELEAQDSDGITKPVIKSISSDS